ncbi:FERM and PDZ domain-containing protein 3 [Segatella oris]|uniref:DUF7833 domain-containing protein n=1 Tax=Segatella oris TaxID=28135 RepID=UPI0028E52B2E|nr:FERM and PDZ domain-containing protein 3 [Segatella oris]
MENNRMQRGNMAARNHRAMNKSTLHVRLGISFLNSYDMTMLKEKYGIAGWGIAVFMMKYLIERRTDCRAPLYVISEIAHACHKNQKTILQIINDFPSLFQINSNNKVLFSPYLQQFFGYYSANNERLNRSLDKLTNGTLDNQEVSFSKNKELEQEQITTKEKKRKVASLTPSQGGECDVEEKGGRRKESATVMHATASYVSKRQKTRIMKVWQRAEHTAETPPLQVEMGVTCNLLSQLYQDNDYMTSLERIANLAVRMNFVVRRNLLLWFQHYCQSYAKRVKDVADAKDYLANLMRPESNTRAQFMAYQNKLYSIKWAKKQALKEESRNCSGFVNASNSLSSKALLVSA